MSFVEMIKAGPPAFTQDSGTGETPEDKLHAKQIEEALVKSELRALEDSIHIAIARLQDHPVPGSEKRIANYEDVGIKAASVLSSLNGNENSFALAALKSMQTVIQANSTAEDESDSIDAAYHDRHAYRARYVPPTKQDVANDSLMAELIARETGLGNLIQGEERLAHQASHIAVDARSDLSDAVEFARLLREETPEAQNRFLEETARKIGLSGAASGLSQEQAQGRMGIIAREGRALAQSDDPGQALLDAAQHIAAFHLAYHRENVQTHMDALQAHFGELPQAHRKAMEDLGRDMNAVESHLASGMEKLRAANASAENAEHYIRDSGLAGLFEQWERQGQETASHLHNHTGLLHASLKETRHAHHELGALLAGESNKGMADVAKALHTGKADIVQHVAHFRNAHHMRPEQVQDEVNALNKHWKNKIHVAQEGHGHARIPKPS